MKREIILSPSILSANFYNIENEILILQKYNVKYLHLDVMDGQFVKNISFGIPVIKSLKKNITSMVFDTHLMIVDPHRYIKDFKESGSDIITIHFEATKDIAHDIKYIKDLGLKVALSINPETPVYEVFKYIEQVDMILLMSVHPGFSGQSFIEDTFDKIKKLRSEADRLNINLDIEVDGGIDFTNINKVIDCGANVIVMGSTIFNGNIEENLKKYFTMII